MYVSWFKVKCRDLLAVEIVFGKGCFQKKITLPVSETKKLQNNTYLLSIKSISKSLFNFKTCTVFLVLSNGEKVKFKTAHSGKMEDLNDSKLFLSAYTKMKDAGVKF